VAWLLLKINANEHNAEAISDALMEIGALSASIEDANAETETEQAIFGEPGDPPPGIWQNNIVTAMFENDADIGAIIAALQNEVKGFNTSNFQYRIETIADQDWVRATQAQFDPIKITDKLWIVPTWHNAPNE
jgi:ribosomal protein L11 methyltransferase